MVASRPTISPLASIITHFFSISAGLAEKVLMANTSGKTNERGCARPAAHTPSILDGQRSPEFKMMQLQYVALMVFSYRSELRTLSNLPGRNWIGHHMLQLQLTEASSSLTSP